MAAIEIEATIVGLYWSMVETQDGRVLRIADRIEPAHFEHPEPRAAFGTLVDAFAAGRPAPELPRVIRDATSGEFFEFLSSARYQATPDDAGKLIRILLESWRARRQTLLLEDAGTESRRLMQQDPADALRYGEEVTGVLTEIHAAVSERDVPQTRAEIIAAELAAMDADHSERGVSWPIPRLERVIGSLSPGEVVGLSGMPGSGKSTLAANLFAGWCRRGVPVIAFPTEMRERWLSHV